MRNYTLRHQAFLLGLVLADLVCVGGAYGAAFALRLTLPLPFTADLLPAARLVEVSHPLLFLLATQGLVLYFFSLYDLHVLQLRGRVMPRALAATGLQLLLTTAWYFFRGEVFFPRSVLVLFWLFNALMIGLLRLGLLRRLGRAHPVQILLVGAPGEIRPFLEVLQTVRPLPALRVVGLVGLSGLDGLPARHEDAAGLEEFDLPWLGDATELERIVRDRPVDDIILLASTTWKDTLVERLLSVPAGQTDNASVSPYHDTGRPRVLVVPSVYDILVGRLTSVRLHDVPLVEAIKEPHHSLAFLLKAALDRCIAALLLVLSLPVLGLAAAGIAATSPGPIVYRQRRVGRGGEEFTLYKLRTMVDGAEERTGPVLASSSDPRVTRLGRFLRESRIDELPQLWNVLNGSMSLVGPRPERPEFAHKFLHSVPGYAERLQVKPGLTGLAQINGEYHTSPEYKLKYDLAYMYNYSVWLDLRILSDTVKIVLSRRGV